MDINLFHKKDHILSNINPHHTKYISTPILVDDSSLIDKNSLTELEKDIVKSLGGGDFAEDQWLVIQSYIFSEKTSREKLKKQKQEKIVTMRSRMEVIDFPGFSESNNYDSYLDPAIND